MPVHVDLIAFLRTGDFGPLHLGMARQEFIALLENPGNFHQGPKDRQPTIYKCGDFEFYFPSSGDGLEMIYSDDFTTPCGNRSLEILPGWIRGDMLLHEVEENLTRAEVEFEQGWGRIPQTTYLKTRGGVNLEFDWESSEGQLYAMILRSKSVGMVP